MSIEVHIAGRGRVRDGETTMDEAQKAHCGLCGKDTDVVVSVALDDGERFGCRDCLRARLEATTVAAYLLQAPGGGLPWGRISG